MRELGPEAPHPNFKCFKKPGWKGVDYLFRLLFLLLLVTAGYKKAKRETSHNKVFFEIVTVCNNGRARYQLDLAQDKKYQVTKEFLTAVCQLPEKYKEKDYFKFIENWGTVSILTFFFYGYILVKYISLLPEVPALR